jgi:penicillin-binding protein 1A
MTQSPGAQAGTPNPPPKIPRSAAWPWWLRALAWLFGGLGALALAVVTLVVIALAVAYPNLPEIRSLVDYRPKLPLRVYSVDGVLLGEFGEERRQFVPIAQVPKVLQDAVLASEDARFFEHGGVDYKGVVRAGFAQFAEAKSQGASTITMQVARNFYLSSEKTFIRKIYEILLALKIESQLTKPQILEVYMNQIYLGQRAYGFAAASEAYFGKPMKDLSIAEAAMLAGLPKAPSAYNPIVNPKRATARQHYVIDRMVENAFISPEQGRDARAEMLRYRRQAETSTHAEFVAEAARQLVFERYGEEAYSRGLNAITSIRAAEQTVAYRALRRGILDYEQRQVYRGPEAYIVLPNDAPTADARIAEALAEHPDNDELKAAVVLEASPRKVVAVLANGDEITVTGTGLRPVTSGLAEKAPPQKQIRRGAIVRAVQGAKGDWALTQLPEVEGAFVALDPATGTIRAMVGGFDFGKNKFNHATQAWRQPGSAFKPFIYSAALQRGFTPATVVNDAPLFFDAAATGSQPWEPKNYDGTFDGPMSLRRGLAKSKNMVSIRVLQSIGPGFAQDWLGRFGFEPEKHPAYLTMALGAGSVTPLQMADAYAVFANGGYRIEPTLILKLTDDKGKTLYQYQPPEADESRRVLDARNAFVMTSLLNEVTRSGTAARAQGTLKRTDVYGKTGTTNDSHDAWFVGWQPSVVAAVWIGYDQPKKLGSRETGGALALPVWIEYMTHALKGVPVATLEPPAGVVNLGGEWFYEEYSRGAGVASVGMEDYIAPPRGPTEDERQGILDLFKR